MIYLNFTPEKDIKDGLIAKFANDPNDEKDVTEYAFADVHKGQTEYELPTDTRKLIGVYIKIL